MTPGQDPRTASAQWLDDKLAGRPVPPLVLVVGLGEGHLLDVLEERAPATRVLALEPRQAMAEKLRARPRWARWTAGNRLQYLVGPDYSGADEISRALPMTGAGHVTLIDPALERRIDEPLVNAVRVLNQIVDGARANAEARQRFAPRYLANTLRNLPALLQGSDMSALSGAFRGIPAVVAGAGPSLDRNLAELKSLPGRALLVATDTALRPMLTAGVPPPFVVGVDPGEINGRHFRWLPERPQTWLVGEPSLDPMAIEPFGGRAFWFRVARHQPWPWYQELGVDVAQLEVWGSVLTAAFQFAVFAGCDPIVFVGADLSFTEGRPYARGTTFELDWAKRVAEGVPLPDQWRARVSASGPEHVEVADRRGVATPTTRTLLLFRDWLLARAPRCGRRVINASGAGMLFGDGVEQASLADVLRDPIVLPAVETIRRTPPRRQPHGPDLAASLRMVHAGRAAEWAEFCGDGYDASRFANAIDAAMRDLKAGQEHVAASNALQPKAGLIGLPEREAVLRAALTGVAIPEWARGPALTGLLAGDMVAAVHADAARLLQAALVLGGVPCEGAGGLGDDAHERWGGALLDARLDWSDVWRTMLWDYHDALAIAAASSSPCSQSLATTTLESSLRRLAGDIEDETRACATDDLRTIDLCRVGVHGYNVLRTGTGCVAAAHRIGPRDLRDASAVEVARLAQRGLLLWGPGETETIERVERYLRCVARLVLVHEWATVTRCPLRGDVFRTLLSRAAGVRS